MPQAGILSGSQVDEFPAGHGGARLAPRSCVWHSGHVLRNGSGHGNSGGPVNTTETQQRWWTCWHGVGRSGQ